MRSRYTAYTQANIEYILQTMKAPAANRFDAQSAKHWASKVKWLGLKVLHSSGTENKGQVEFIAYFSEDGKEDCIHELSDFHQIENRWYYVDGKHRDQG